MLLTVNDNNPIAWGRIVRIGLLGGVGLVFVSLVGMVETFSERDIISGIISMAQTLLLVAVFGSAYLAASTVSGRGRSVAVGAISAGLSAAVLAGLLLIGSIVNLRGVLVNASPTLYQILTFGLPLAQGSAAMLAFGAGAGALAGLLYSLSDRLRRPIARALLWVALLGLLSDLIRVTFVRVPVVGLVVRLVFGTATNRGFTPIGAVLIFALVVGLSYRLALRPLIIRERLQALPAGRRRRVQIGLFALLGLLLIILPRILGLYLSEVANNIGLFILLGLGLNIVVGFAGLLDLGYVAFFAIGAYVMGVLTSQAIGTEAGQILWGPQLSFWTALPIAVAASALAGIILGVPVLRMRGDYLAIVTLGFGEIIRIMALSDALKPYIGGSQGIVRVEPALVGSISFRQPQFLFYILLAGCALVAFVAIRLKDSRLGRAWMAMREDEDVAQAMGINLIKTKLSAFAVGAAFSGLSGAVFASKLGSIYPHSFSLLTSLTALSLIIVGGMGSIPGVFVGALALVGLPELLREFAEYRLLVYGAVLVAMMLLRPEGMIPDVAHRRELRVAEEPALRPEPVQTPAGD
ncbi:MAG: branched-chain amino acid ABC transporter permease [Anaerolineales bacterium]